MRPLLNAVDILLVTLRDTHTHSLAPVDSLLDGLRTRRLSHILIVSNAELSSEVLRADKGQDDDIDVDAGHEDADNLAVLVAEGLALGRKRESLADAGLDGGRSGGDKVAELVGGTDHEGTEGTGGQFHEMDGDDAPGALDAELFEERRSDDGSVVDVGVRVQKSSPNNGNEDDRESTSEYLRAVSDHRSSSHGAKVGHYLGNSDRIGGEVVLVGQHGRVQILRSVGHEVEASHEKDHVGQEKPMPLQCHSALSQEGLGNVALGNSDGLSLLEGFGLGHHETGGDDENRWASSEPEEWAPAVGSGVYKAASEDCRKQVAKGISLL